MLLFTFVFEDSPPLINNRIKIDETLIKRIGQDDKNAFRDFYALTERTLYGYILSLVKNPEDTLDILHDTYIKIRASAHLYKPMGKPLAWIFTIARNLSMTKLSRDTRTSGELPMGMENSLTFSYVTDPEDRLVLESALSILEEDERTIIILHAVSGLRFSEIAQNLSKPISTVMSRYHRALKKLRNHIKI
ncbi:MAG: RNA polymerase sigma factor [Clostridiaceae bacterium]